MRNFLVNVNGTQYEVAVEEIDGKTAPAAKPVAAPAPAAPAPAAASANGTKVTCPMPGTILEVKVQDGDKVKAGQAIFVLEAMKMESDIPAPVAGTVRGVSVQKGASVDTGALLCSIE
jgi:biotin carboxyl carrier protein